MGLVCLFIARYGSRRHTHRHPLRCCPVIALRQLPATLFAPLNLYSLKPIAEIILGRGFVPNHFPECKIARTATRKFHFETQVDT